MGFRIQVTTRDQCNRVRVYTTKSCGDCLMATTVLERADIDYEEIDVDQDPSAAALVVVMSGDYRSVPTLLLPYGRLVVERCRGDLLAALGLWVAGSHGSSP